MDLRLKAGHASPPLIYMSPVYPGVMRPAERLCFVIATMAIPAAGTRILA